MKNVSASKNSFAWRPWLLPFVIGLGMACGSLLGISFFSTKISEQGASGDLAGAAGALLVTLCLGAGFTLSFLTVVIGKMLRRDEPSHLLIRLFASLLGGVLAGVLGLQQSQQGQTLFMILLPTLPVLLAWPFNAGKSHAGGSGATR